MLDSAAMRFYQRSRDATVAKTAPQPASVKEGIRALNRPGHRYHCVYEELSAAPGRHVCELGYGGPELVPALASLSASYTVVDIVDRYSGSAPANVNVVLSDLNNDFPFEDGQFDIVVAMMVVEHLFDPFHSFKEIARICKPGAGKIFVNLPNVASIRCRWALLRGRMPVTSSADWFEKREWDGNHLHNFTISETLRLANLYGLRRERVYSVGHGLALKRLMPGLFCHEVSFCFSRR